MSKKNAADTPNPQPATNDAKVTQGILSNPGNKKARETWLDAQDLKQWLNISDRTLARWRSQNLLPYCKIYHKIYYNQRHVDEMMEKHMIRGKK